VAGASLGLATLWLALFTFPLMAAVQFRVTTRAGYKPRERTDLTVAGGLLIYLP
jgi:hypothetical protein